MNIQIYGKKKCFDTKKAERWFKERKIKYQMIDIIEFGFSPKEFDNILRAVKGADNLFDSASKHAEADIYRYLSDVRAKEDKLFEFPEIIKTPIVRNGKDATVGYVPDIWKEWK